jgi:multicomponent Na+:H+ antiporter subunit E
VKVRTWPVVGVALAVVWLFVRGVEPTAVRVVEEFLIGLVVGLPLAFAFRRLAADRVDIGRAARTVPDVLRYLAVFSREVVVANVDVAYRAVAPGPPIEPEVILIPLRVETPLGITTIANSITITPGTVTLDHDEDVNAIYVHLIDGRDPADVVEPIRTWEDYALRIFDEELDPEDPAGEFVVSGGERRD